MALTTSVCLSQIERLHAAMGALYPLPNLDSPLIVVCEEIEGAAAAVKLIGEAYLWLDPALPMRQKLRLIAHLDEKCYRAARERGLEDVSCWVPPHVEQHFGKILDRLGWSKSQWPVWSRLIR